MLFATSSVLRSFIYTQLIWMLLGVSIVCCSAWTHCGKCRCNQLGKSLILNCSDLQLLDYDGGIRVPYADSYEPHFNFSKILAEFRRSGIRSVTTITISRLENLSLADNFLEELPPLAFTRLRSLKCLSVSNNSITTVRENSLDGLENLEVLDFSHNKMSIIETKAFQTLKSLKHLSLSHNNISSIVDGVLSLPLLETLDLSHNDISALTYSSFMNIPRLHNLSLSHNNLAIIDVFAFDPLPSLNTLYLSWNNISFLGDSLFASLNALEHLYLDNNKLERLSKDLELPNKLHLLDLSANLLKDFDELPSTMSNLHELILEENALHALNFKDSTLQNLKILNVACNNITRMSVAWKFPFLEEINLSHNQLQEIPADLTAGRLPVLRYLYLDKNPLLRIKFPSDEEPGASFVNLTLVSARHLPNLQELGPNAFTALSAPCGLGCGNEACRRHLDVDVSHCPRLSVVHPDAFDGVGLCQLHLSYNALSALDKDVVNWRKLEKADLQRNPWDCSCAHQWMLDTLLPHIYQTHPELLNELRCETPAKLRSFRLVHFLNWKGSALCHQMEELKTTNHSVDQDISVDYHINTSYTAVLVVVCALGIVLQIVLSLKAASKRGRYPTRMIYYKGPRQIYTKV